MAAVNLDKMSLKEMRDLQDKLARAIVTARERERTEVKQKVEAMVQGAGFNMNELFSGRGRAKSTVAKYANPDDRTETWTGRGRKPNWLNQKLQKGAKIDDFAIR